ncbi:MAG: class I SAM-dependent methyltransferase [Candidatus Binataceae bacterium]
MQITHEGAGDDTLCGWGERQKAAYFFENAEVIIPHRRAQLALLADLLPWPPERPLRVLDLGAGFGAVTEQIMARYPHASFVCVDGSEEMIELARSHLAQYGERVRLMHRDMAVASWCEGMGTGFDAAVSALAIHHLTDERKRALCAELFALLAPGGIFLNDEAVAAPPALKERFDALALREIQSQERALRGLTRPLEEIRAELNERLRAATRHSHIAAVEPQLEWLRAAGFEAVDCYWRFLSLAIFGGIKPAV